MNAYSILIFLCGLVIFSYLFDLFAKRTRVPSVLLLLLLGIGLRMIADRLGFKLFDIQQLLPTLGTVGLILIVFEGALELTYELSKRTYIRKAFVSALVLLLVTTAATANDESTEARPYITPMPSRAMTLANMTLARLGVASKVPVIVLWRYSEPTVSTPMARVSR